jgi:ParB family chromosome partitioning protein
MADTTFATVPLGQLRESKTNPRRSFEPKALEELTASIKAKGLLTPLLVRPSSGHHEIVAGHRRFRAARAAGLTELFCQVRELTDTEVLEIQVIENLQRADVHPLEEAEGYRRLLEAKGAGYDVPAIAAKVGKSVSYVYQRLKLAELIEPAKKAFLLEELTAGHAILLARLQPKDQAAAVKAAIREHWVDGRDRVNEGRVRAAISVRELGAWIQTNVHMALDKASFPTDDPTLLPSAGACGPCPKRSGNAPELFADVKHPDTCTDRVCFGAKVEAWLQRRREEAKTKALTETTDAPAPLAAKVPKVVNLSLDWSADRPNTLGTQQWQRAAKGDCPNVAMGVVVDAHRGYEERGKLGDVVRVCLAEGKRCRVHNRPPARGEAETSWSRQQRQGQERAKAATARRVAILKAIRAKVTGLPTRPVLEMVALGYWKDIWFEHRKRLATLHGWKSPETPTAAVSKMTDAELGQLLVSLAVVQDLHVSPNYSTDMKALTAVAKLYKVDVAKVERELAAAAKGKQAKATPAKKKRRR